MLPKSSDANAVGSMYQRSISFFLGVAFYYINRIIKLTNSLADKLVFWSLISFIIHNVIIGVIGIVHPELINYMKPINFTLFAPEAGLFALGCQHNQMGRAN